MVDNNETPKTTNPYARPTVVKCFKCNLPGYGYSDCALRKAVHLVEREEEEVICEPEEEKDYEEGDEKRNYMVRILMVIPTQEEKSKNVSSPIFPIIVCSKRGIESDIN